jgi:hypothetical protein
MAEVINTNVFDAEKKFVDFAGLDYFWDKAKKYVDDADKVTADKVTALEETVGDDTKGLIKDFKDLKAYAESLGDIEGGEGLGGMIDSKIAALDVEDAAVDGQYVSSVAEVDGKVVVTRANLPVYEKVGVAAGLNEAMDERVKVLEAIDHDKLAADAASAAVATVLDGAPEKFDTLKEVAQWIADSESAATAADLVTRVSVLEAIEHDAYVEADTKVLDDAKAFAEGLVMVDGVAKFETAGVAEGLVNDLANGAVKTNTEAIAVINGAGEGSIAKAKADAIADAEAKLKAVTDTLKSAAFVEVATLEATMDSKDATNLAAAKTYAATYTDELFDSFQFATTGDIDGLFIVKAE